MAAAVSGSGYVVSSDSKHEPSGGCYENTHMAWLFLSVKPAWVPTVGYRATALAEQGSGRYLMQWYKWTRPHQHNGFVPPSVAEKNQFRVRELLTTKNALRGKAMSVKAAPRLIVKPGS